MSVKEVQLKLIKGEISKISSLTHYHFHLDKFTGMKTDFPIEENKTWLQTP